MVFLMLLVCDVVFGLVYMATGVSGGKAGAYNNRNGPERTGMGLHNRNGYQN